MPQLESEKLIKRLIRTVTDVISGRTSESYAAMIMNNVFRKLYEKYDFLRYIEIKNPQISETFDVINIKSDLDYIKLEDIGKVTEDIINEITGALGRNGGYFFIKEIKEELPSDHEQVLKKLGVDLDIMQLEYITQRTDKSEYRIENSEVLKQVFKALFDVLDREQGRDFAFSTIDELVNRFSTKYKILDLVKVNDIRTVQGVDIISIAPDVESVQPDEVGEIIQKILQETNNYLNEKDCFSFVEKLETHINAEYTAKLVEMGVNLNAMHLKQGLVVKRIIKALVDVLSDASSRSYAVLTVDTALRKIYDKYDSLKYVKIDSSKYSGGMNAVSVSSDIDTASPAEVGKGIQKLIEKVVFSLGEEAGRNFINRLKKRLSKAYLLRIEEMGVNLYMIELRHNLMW